MEDLILEYRVGKDWYRILKKTEDGYLMGHMLVD